MAFTNLDLRTIDDKPEYFLLLSDCTYTWTDDDQVDHSHTVDKGTETDLASIPRVVRGAFKRTGLSRKPAVFHDDWYGKKLWTRKKCDQLFRQMLLERGMGRFAAGVYYHGVRAGGWTRGRW